jgi:hypothetical protein
MATVSRSNNTPRPPYPLAGIEFPSDTGYASRSQAPMLITFTWMQSTKPGLLRRSGESMTRGPGFGCPLSQVNPRDNVFCSKVYSRAKVLFSKQVAFTWLVGWLVGWLFLTTSQR